MSNRTIATHTGTIIAEQRHTDLTTTSDLDYAITKATDNIRRADRMGLKHIAQQTRRDRKAMIAQRDALVTA